MNIPYRILLFAVLAPVCLFLPPANAELPKETRWADPSFVELYIEFPGDGYHASWQLFRCDCGDLLVRSNLNVPGEGVSGEAILVQEKAVLSRGFGKYREEGPSSLDVAGLMMQLALRLLERAVPAGPAAVQAATDVHLEDTVNHITLDTGGAVGGFQAPWSIEGAVAPLESSKRRFNLDFQFTTLETGEAATAVMRLRGDAEFARTAFPVPADSPLEGWDLSWRDESAALDSDASTLEELRTLLAR
jgi:hypothetical protein